MVEDEYYTIEEVSKLLKISQSQVRKWIRNNELKVIRFSHKILRISKEELLKKGIEK